MKISMLSHPLVEGRGAFLEYSEFIRSACEDLVPESGRVNIILVGEKRMSLLNRKYKLRRGTTEILTFPYEEFPEAGEEDPPLVGEIILCWRPVLRGAALRGVSAANYMLRLVVHGLFHLRGYSHSNAAEESRMEKVEREYLSAFMDNGELDRLFD